MGTAWEKETETNKKNGFLAISEHCLETVSSKHPEPVVVHVRLALHIDGKQSSCDTSKSTCMGVIDPGVDECMVSPTAQH